MFLPTLEVTTPRNDRVPAFVCVGADYSAATFGP